MRELAERAYFLMSLALGRLLRSSTYSTARIVQQDGELHVRKQRRFYAPLLVWLGDPLVKVLDAGIRVLPRRDWQERERLVYQRVHGASIRIEGDATLILPHLPGMTLAELLENPKLEKSLRKTAIELAVNALAEFHQMGFTHGDAMAENVMVDLNGGIARWFDFETIHETNRPIEWRRADDVRALIATSLLRTTASDRADTLQLILAGYADENVIRCVRASFASVWHRPLTFHLGQAGLSFQDYRQIGSLLRDRVRD